VTEAGIDIHGEDTSSTSDIENNLVLKKVCVLVDGVLVGVGTDFVLLQSELAIVTRQWKKSCLPTSPRGYLKIK
jgi:hypothetical protein